MIAGRPRLGAFLIEQQIITESELDTAIRHQIARGCRLGRALIDLDLCTDADIARALADQLEIPFIDLEENPPVADSVALLPREVALEYGVLPLRREGKRLLVAVLDPYDIRIDEVLLQTTGLRPLLVMAPESQIQRLLRQYCSEALLEDMPRSGQAELEEVPDEEESELRVDELAAAGEQTSVIRIVNILIADAVRRGASDLHIEPGEAGIRIRCRIDGRMYPVATLPGNLLQSVVARCKIMSGMDISESRKPQDGSCTLKVDGQTLELRVSTIRGVQGEIVVARLLYKEAGTHDLDVLGFQPGMLQDLRRLLAARHGMLLITGPTGAGKTTTLYAALNHLNRDDLNVITIEDPVESKLAGINHIEVHDRAGRSFATALRSVLRQDPDVIMLGEIRDAETAEIACRAALTGHLVLSSLHTQHTLGAVARLLDIGLEPWLVAACLNGVLGQRLVRRNCDQCTERYTPPPGVQKAFESRYGSLEGVRFQKGRGCTACNGAGSKGRIGVHELLVFDDPMREFLIRGPHLDELKQYVLRQGFRSIEDDAFQKACAGLIAPEEVIHLGFSLATEVADLSPTQDCFSGAAFGKATPASQLQPAAASVSPPAEGESVIDRAPGAVALLPPPVEPATPEPEVSFAVIEEPTQQPLEAPSLPEAVALEQTVLEPAVEPPTDHPALPASVGNGEWRVAREEPLRSEPSAPPVSTGGTVLPQPTASAGDDPLAHRPHGRAKGDQPSRRPSEEAPPMLLHSSAALEKARSGRDLKVKKQRAPSGRLWHFPIRNASRDQWMVRGAAGTAIVLFVGLLTLRPDGLWSPAPLQAKPAHPQSRSGYVSLDTPGPAVSLTASPRPPTESGGAFVGPRLDSQAFPPNRVAVSAAKVGARGSTGRGSDSKRLLVPRTHPDALVASPGSAAPRPIQKYVWCCPGGRYYHRRHCKRVEKRMQRIPLSVAVREGKHPCPSCKPGRGQ